MADVVLIVTVVILSVMVLVASFYFLIYFQHPDDRLVAWFPKFIVILGVTISCYNILLLPVDVANQKGQVSTLNKIPMAQIDTAFFIVTIVLAMILVPFTMYYYEGVDDSDDTEEHSDVAKQVLYALKWLSFTVILYFLVVALLWHFYGYADIDVQQLSASFQPISDPFGNFCDPTLSTALCTKISITETVNVSFAAYMIAIASLVGWVLFTFFGGVGLGSLPFDLIIDYKHRPRPIRIQEYTEKKKMVGEQAELLLRASTVLTDEMKKNARSKNSGGRYGRKLKRQENEFKRDVLFLESQYRKLEDAYKNAGGNPLVHYFFLSVGLVGSVLSLLWFLHIILYVLPIQVQALPISGFLNGLLIGTSNVPIVGIVIYGAFAFWLVLSVLKGVLKIGLRFLFVTIHPIKIGETMMTALLFNVGLLLFCSLAVSQFCAIAFSQYAQYTATLTLFSSQLNNLRGIHYVYDALIFGLPVMIFISFVYVTVKPNDSKAKPVF